MNKHLNKSSWQDKAIGHLLEKGVVDAHHHILGRAQRRERGPDIWGLLSETYLFKFVLSSAGFRSARLFESEKSEKQVEELLPYLKLAKGTTYYSTARRGLLGAFGFDINDLNKSNWLDLDSMIQQANECEDWFDDILVKRMGIRGGVLDKQVGGTLVDAMTTRTTLDWYHYILKIRPNRDNTEVNSKTKFRQADWQPTSCAVKIDSLLYGYLECVGGELQELFGVSSDCIRDMDAYLDYVNRVFSEIVSDNRNVALKIAIAGVRSLYFPDTDRCSAAKVFAAQPDQLSPEDAACFENFMMHHICHKAEEHNLPIQIHTGAGPGGYNSDIHCSSSLLTNLFAAHPDTKFDLMHGSYPNYGECALLVTRFPNVNLNLSWLTMVSNADARRALRIWLDQVPANKIMWGGDCVYIEEAYGVFLLSCEQVIDVLWEKIAEGAIDQNDALLYLTRIFRDNAAEFFGIAL